MLHERVASRRPSRRWPAASASPSPRTGFEAGPDRKERKSCWPCWRRRPSTSRGTCGRAGHEGARVPARARLQEGDAREDPRGRRARCVDGPGRHASKQIAARWVAETAGLVRGRPGRQAGPYDRFRNRAVFPILSDAGKVVAFGARALRRIGAQVPELARRARSTRRAGRSTACPGRKTASAAAGRVVLMEGYLDVARAVEAGVTEAVATCGTALTAGPCAAAAPLHGAGGGELRPGRGGQKAARKSLDILRRGGAEGHVVELPEGHDPDTFLKAEGADAYRRALRRGPGGHGMAHPPRGGRDTTRARRKARPPTSTPCCRACGGSRARWSGRPGCTAVVRAGRPGRAGGAGGAAARPGLRGARGRRRRQRRPPAPVAPRPAVLLPAGEGCWSLLVLADAEGVGGGRWRA